MASKTIGSIDSQEDKIEKLKNMRRIATGLLILMAVLYITFKRFEDRNIFFSMLVAFSEASMIGALADWFAVVALFRHPLGMSWIPHTAIIQKNKDRIGESLSSFVVSNFFTDEIIKSKMQDVHITENIASYIERNKESIIKVVVQSLPNLVERLFNNERLREFTLDYLKGRLKEMDMMPLLEKSLKTLASSGLHMQVVKLIVREIHQWVIDNKEQTFRILEGIDKKLTLPFIGDIVYKSVLNSLAKLAEDMEKGETPEFLLESLSKLSDRLIYGTIHSQELQERITAMKSEFLESDQFRYLFMEKASEYGDMLTAYCTEENPAIRSKVGEGLQYLLDYLKANNEVRENVDSWMKTVLANLICSYRYEIAELIRDTVENWPMEDMVDKLETQVGGDLQYIRINGTVIGGLAGLAIHLLSYLF